MYVVALALGLAGCAGGTAEQTSATPAPAASSTTPGAQETSESHGAGHDHGEDRGPAGLPSQHVHGIALGRGDDKFHLATHDGLFRYDGTGYHRVGPVIDLMGFTSAGPRRFYASGHPGPDVRLPNPVGLIESTDGGRTWQSLSRGGSSDLHALAASRRGIFGFDGVLRFTAEGRTWMTLADVPAFSLAASPDARTVVATTESGPIRSTDAGRTWVPVESGPLLMLVAWADDRSVVGVTPDGTIALSTDSGETWQQRGSVGDRPTALGAVGAPGRPPRIAVVTSAAVHTSTDGGETFTAVGAT